MCPVSMYIMDMLHIMNVVYDEVMTAPTYSNIILQNASGVINILLPTAATEFIRKFDGGQYDHLAINGFELLTMPDQGVLLTPA